MKVLGCYKFRLIKTFLSIFPSAFTYCVAKYLPFANILTTPELPKFLRGDWSRCLRVTIRVRKFPVQTPLGTRPILRTQPHAEVPGDLRVEIVKTQ